MTWATPTCRAAEVTVGYSYSTAGVRASAVTNTTTQKPAAQRAPAAPAAATPTTTSATPAYHHGPTRENIPANPAYEPWWARQLPTTRTSPRTLVARAGMAPWTRAMTSEKVRRSTASRSRIRASATPYRTTAATVSTTNTPTGCQKCASAIANPLSSVTVRLVATEKSRKFGTDTRRSTDVAADPIPNRKKIDAPSAWTVPNRAAAPSTTIATETAVTQAAAPRSAAPASRGSSATSWVGPDRPGTEWRRVGLGRVACKPGPSFQCPIVSQRRISSLW